ncbi:MAG: hypothetical protein ABL901_20240 [Hyphomicrobiaceae bacterium]
MPHLHPLERDFLHYVARLGRAARICDDAFYSRLETLIRTFRARGLSADMVPAGIRLARSWRDFFRAQVAA